MNSSSKQAFSCWQHEVIHTVPYKEQIMPGKNRDRSLAWGFHTECVLDCLFTLVSAGMGLGVGLSLHTMQISKEVLPTPTLSATRHATDDPAFL